MGFSTQFAVRDESGHHPRFMLMDLMDGPQFQNYIEIQRNPTGSTPGIGIFCIAGEKKVINFRFLDDAGCFEECQEFAFWHTDSPNSHSRVRTFRDTRGKIEGLQCNVGGVDFSFQQQIFAYNWELRRESESNIDL